ncbi:hypothetical protein HMPREF3038_02479 [Akkermansia sp. KLE1797]|nr:hypothetical protein HMPREF3038_02479 [Akkermansia sp. KLE1797]KXU54788.1 hypothetical protein HMPREF3039_00935 [Akkermansia sp. KLE1798]
MLWKRRKKYFPLEKYHWHKRHMEQKYIKTAELNIGAIYF